MLSVVEYKTVAKSECKDEEVIRCICGVLREEGEMLMCDKCEVSNCVISVR